MSKIFAWCIYIWKEVWVLPKEFPVDEQICKMLADGIHKTGCGKYKRNGDAIQTGCILDNGFKWDFYLRNEPVD